MAAVLVMVSGRVGAWLIAPIVAMAILWACWVRENRGRTSVAGGLRVRCGQCRCWCLYGHPSMRYPALAYHQAHDCPGVPR
jgi:hypothetical protein